MEDKQKHCTIYIVRHGESEWNVKGLIQGQKDSVLTQTGIKQAAALSKKLKKTKFDAAFSSDLLRAKKTAEIILLEHDLEVKTKTMLRERNFGSLEGKSSHKVDSDSKELLQKYELLSDKEKFTFRFKDEETDEEMIGRFITLIREIAISYIGKRVLVVSHGGIIRIFLIHLGFATYDQLPRGSIDNTGYVKLLSDGVDFFVKETQGINKKS